MTINTILPIPDIFSAKRILCIQPHYDDNDIGAAGILMRLQQNGAEIFYLTVTDDLMGVVDDKLSNEEAAQALKRDQYAAGKIVGVKEQVWLGYPDAGEYDYFAIRRDILKYIRMMQPDFIFTADPWLTYEAHRDHIQTGMAASEAIILSGLRKNPTTDPTVDAAYNGHDIKGIVFYFTREPNYIADVSSTWEEKIRAVRCYGAQFDSKSMEQLVVSLDLKSQQVARGESLARGEPLKVLHPNALHLGI
ncbi:MAG: PIG-L deacetylase family protein [Anaerolineales bacterium]